MNAIWAIARKDLLLLLRDKAGLFWVAGFPFVMAILFGFFFGGGGGKRGELAVLLVDEDKSAWSEKFAANIDKLDTIAITPAASLAEAEGKVASGKAAALLHVRAGAGARILPFGDDSAIELGIDPARKMEAQLLQGMVLQTAFMQLRDRMFDQGFMMEQLDLAITDLAGADSEPQSAALRSMLGQVKNFMSVADDDFLAQGLGGKPAAEGSAAPANDAAEDALAGMMRLPVREISRIETGPRTGFEISFPSGIMWGMVGICAGFAISLVQERRGGTLARLQMAPVGRSSVLAGKALGCLLGCLAIASALLLTGNLAFGLRVVNLPALAAGVVLAAACFTGIMMLLSTLGETEAAVSGSGWAVMMVMMMLGGGMIPLFAMPGWMATASNLSPVKWAVFALEGAIWRGATWGELLPAYAVLAGVAGACFAAGAVRLKR